MNYTVYILWSNKIQRYYVGSTKDVEDRISRHNSGEGKYTHRGVPWELVWKENFTDRKEAVQLELKIKKRGIKRYLLDIKYSGSSAGR